MTPAQFRAIRDHVKLTEAEFASELGYAGTENNRKTLIREYERGKKAPIPAYIARLAFMISEHFDAEEGCLPEWPPFCNHNPPKPNGAKR